MFVLYLRKRRRDNTSVHYNTDFEIWFTRHPLSVMFR